MKKIINPFIFIALAVLLRLVPHLPNFAPIAAMALFGGVYLNKKYALIVPLIAMFISDMFLGFHNVMPFVYGSFLATGFIGLWLKKHKSVQNILAASFASSLLFYVVTNFGVWAMDSLYPKTFAGLIDCYVMAISFFRNTVMGDLFYTGVLFGSYELVLWMVQKTQLASVRHSGKR